MEKEYQNEMRISFPSLSVNEALARSCAAAFCAQCNPTFDELSDIKCAVSEAVTNAIVHGYRDAVGEIYLAMRILPERVIRMEIRDKGCGIPDVSKAMEPLFTTGGAERAGLGFAVMESFMDSVKVRSAPGKGTRVTLSKRLGTR